MKRERDYYCYWQKDNSAFYNSTQNFFYYGKVSLSFDKFYSPFHVAFDDLMPSFHRNEAPGRNDRH